MRDSIEIEDHQYISSRRAAEIARYSQDYIGQLCRSGQVAGKRIGKIWFVDQDSLFQHVQKYSIPVSSQISSGSVPSFLPELKKSKLTETDPLNEVPIRPPINAPPAPVFIRDIITGPGAKLFATFALCLLSGYSVAYALAGYEPAVSAYGRATDATTAYVSGLVSPYANVIAETMPRSLDTASVFDAVGSWWQGVSGAVRTGVLTFLGIGDSSGSVATSTAPTVASSYINVYPSGTTTIIRQVVQAPGQTIVTQNSSNQGLIQNLADRLSALTSAFNAFQALQTLQNQHVSVSYPASTQTIVSSGGGSSGTVTSVDVSGGSTGLSFSGGPVTTSGTIVLDGTLDTVNGGTGTSTAPSYGQLLVGNTAGGYNLLATSSLGITGGGGSGTVNAGTAGQLAYYASNGMTVSGIATSSLNINTDNLVQGVTNLFYSNSLVNSFVNSSSTIPKTYTANAFSGNQTFNGSVNATNGLTANALSVGSLSGILYGTAGSVGTIATSSLNLSIPLASTTGILAIGNGGTSTSTSPTYGQLLVGNAAGGYDLLATSSLGLNLTSLSGTLSVASGGTGQTTYTDGQLLIGNSSNSSLTKATLTGTANEIGIANGNGSITLSTPQPIGTASTPTFASTTLSNFTAGSIPFFASGGSLAQNNANFFWDNVNNRLGIGSSTPGFSLSVNGAGYFGGNLTAAGGLTVSGNTSLANIASSSVLFAGAGGLLSGSPNFTFDGTTASAAGLLVTPAIYTGSQVSGLSATTTLDDDNGNWTNNGTTLLWSVTPYTITSDGLYVYGNTVNSSLVLSVNGHASNGNHNIDLDFSWNAASGATGYIVSITKDPQLLTAYPYNSYATTVTSSVADINTNFSALATSSSASSIFSSSMSGATAINGSNLTINVATTTIAGTNLYVNTPIATFGGEIAGSGPLGTTTFAGPVVINQNAVRSAAQTNKAILSVNGNGNNEAYDLLDLYNTANQTGTSFVAGGGMLSNAYISIDGYRHYNNGVMNPDCEVNAGPGNPFPQSVCSTMLTLLPDVGTTEQIYAGTSTYAIQVSNLNGGPKQYNDGSQDPYYFGQTVFQVLGNGTMNILGNFTIGTTTATTTNDGNQAQPPSPNPFSIYATSTGAFLFGVTQAGNVGIGTSSPSNALEVAGNGFFSGNLTGTNLTATGTLAVTSTTTTGGLSVGSLSGLLLGTSGAVSATTSISNSYLTNSTISGISLGSNLSSLTATDNTLTFSGSYNGSTAQTVGLNLGNANTWTALQTFNNGLISLASSTMTNLVVGLSTTTSATTTNFAIKGITNSFLATNANGTVIATSAPSGGSLSGGVANWLTYWTGAGTVGATSSPTVGYLTATSTTATNYFGGNLQVGQCVTGDTKLRRRRKNKKAGAGTGAGTGDDDEFEDVRIDEIGEGDEILTFDAMMGSFKASKVHRVVYAGLRPIIQIETKGGSTIRTTEEHPYFVRIEKTASGIPNYFNGGAWKAVGALAPGIDIAVLGADGQPVWDTIVSLEKLPEEKVYDIEVAGTHSFVGNGIVAHNTAFYVDMADQRIGIGNSSTDACD